MTDYEREMYGYTYRDSWEIEADECGYEYRNYNNNEEYEEDITDISPEDLREWCNSAAGVDNN